VKKNFNLGAAKPQPKKNKPGRGGVEFKEMEIIQDKTIILYPE